MAYTSLIRKEVHDVGNDGEQASNGQGGAGGNQDDRLHGILLWSDSFMKSSVAPINRDLKLTVSKV